MNTFLDVIGVIIVGVLAPFAFVVGFLGGIHYIFRFLLI